MFALSLADLRKRILGCADGPASFNAEATYAGYAVTSCDPLYRFSKPEIRQRITDTCDVILEQTRKNRCEFVWTDIESVEHLRDLRMNSMERFLADYDAGKAQGRYVEAALPTLPFDDDAFDLALCSHYLFLYSTQVSEDDHVSAIRELLRVSKEVRIFPLVALGGQRSPHLDPVCSRVADACRISIETVPYEFQRGASQMMRLTR